MIAASTHETPLYMHAPDVVVNNLRVRECIRAPIGKGILSLPPMTRLSSSFLLASFSLLAAAQTSLQGNLTSLGLTAYFPGDAQYAGASAACE